MDTDKIKTYYPFSRHQVTVKYDFTVIPLLSFPL